MFKIILFNFSSIYKMQNKAILDFGITTQTEMLGNGGQILIGDQLVLDETTNKLSFNVTIQLENNVW